ncbi:HpcH/HpaI aldolase/citrate lyase family protein [Chelativorans composti]|uniref:HpcH/HpaI aldolase/citrate lyase family protein n=1 Tax=Chelativorans composti TaxID=768533 RepID=A0ABW5DJE8_9HYPH
MTLLAERLTRGEAVFSAWSGLAHAGVVEAIAGLEFQAITLDMQHGAHDEGSVERSLLPITASARHGVVRIPVGRFDMASRALDFGAEAVIAPMINTVEDARRFAAHMKYPPLGERSWAPYLGMQRMGRTDPQEWLRESNRNTLALAMIETREAYALVDEILGVGGIDGVFVGPSDFSIAWFRGERIDPLAEDIMDAIAAVGRKAVAAGKHAGIYITDPPTVGRFHKAGFRFFAIGNENVYMAQGASNLLAAARASL